MTGKGEIIGLKVESTPRPDPKLGYSQTAIQAEIDMHETNAKLFRERAIFEEQQKFDKKALLREVKKLQAEAANKK